MFFRTFVFQLVFYLWTSFLMLALSFLILAPRRMILSLNKFWVKTSFFLLKAIVGIDYKVTGMENLPADGPYIIASLHQSIWDTMVFTQVLPDPIYVYKRSLGYIPIYGWFVKRLGMISVDRKGGAKALREVVVQARSKLSSGFSCLVIFPQGRRVAPGSRIGFKSGVIGIYRQLNLAVIPVRLDSGKYWRRRSLRFKPGVISLEFCPPIESGLGRADFRRRLEGALYEEYEE